MRVQHIYLLSDRIPLECDRFNRTLARISDVYMTMLADRDHRTNMIHYKDMCIESWGNRLLGDGSPLGRDRFNRALRAWISDVYITIMRNAITAKISWRNVHMFADTTKT